MPLIKSAIKRMRQTVVRRARNLRTKRSLRVALKSFSTESTGDSLSKAQSEIDKAVKKNLMPKNTAARKKAQLAKAAKTAGVTLGAKKAAKPAAKPATAKAPAKKAAAKKAAPKK